MIEYITYNNTLHDYFVFTIAVAPSLFFKIMVFDPSASLTFPATKKPSLYLRMRIYNTRYEKTISKITIAAKSIFLLLL